MQVLHAFVPKMDINGFERERVSIFEGDCCAHILFEQKPDTSRRRLKIGKRKSTLRFSLRLAVTPHNRDHTEFNIVSEIVPLP